ncbi:hypothetical protein BS47DRAFT_342737 [Hydnum rufescens UP504]|uniref:Uncharacterized protein n=1 Tax=Hydnum rufescens UP504 TaxID=1448309 RepID=A0A9P6DQ96_9AGAM|nr:hypothetical protein BS47DRAFT_342737 [Hydnum rufescens UP504]
MERAGNLPPQAMAAQDMVQMKIAEVTKMSAGKPGYAADRVILMPCPLAPEDPQTFPFMRKRVVVKTLQLPHDLFYLDRALAARYGTRQRGEPMPDHDYDFTKSKHLGLPQHKYVAADPTPLPSTRIDAPRVRWLSPLLHQLLFLREDYILCTGIRTCRKMGRH